MLCFCDEGCSCNLVGIKLEISGLSVNMYSQFEGNCGGDAMHSPHCPRTQFEFRVD
jgi:hypothetical protein